MRTLATVNDVMSFIRYGDVKHVTLITACSKNIIYSDFYENYPNEMKELDVTLIDFYDGGITLYVL